MAWLLSAIFATSVFAQEGGADNPSETTPVVSISGSGTVSEGGTASFILSAEPPPTDRITVNVWIRQEGIFARVGQAGARTVVIGPSGITQLNIATADDKDDEIDGGFAASVVAGPGYVLHESEFSARVGVTDDDPTPTETTGSISGIVFADNDANGEKHLFERGRLWWRVRLLGAFDVAIDRQSADRQGFYQFQQVPPGEYGIVFHHPSSNVVWSRQTISVSRGATSTLDFPVTASGIVYDSASRNPVSGVRLRLTGGDGTPLAGQCLLPGQQDQATAGDGAYRFDLQPGAAADCPVATSRYKIEIVGAPETHFAAVSGAVSPAAEPLDVAACGAGTMACLVQDSHQPPRQGETALYHLDWILGEDAVTALHNHIPVDPVPAEPQEPEDPEEPEEPEIPGPATALGTIFADDNADGMRGEVEQGRSGWLAELVTEAGEIAGSARSDDQGDYFFAELPDDVGAVRVRHPDSNMVWAERPIAPVADMASRVDFPLAVGGVIYDSIERTPIPGVRLHLSGSQGSPIAAQCLLPGQQGQTVGADGAYRFDLQPGAHADCPVAATDYGIEIGEVPDAWLAGESLLLPPEPGVLDVAACAVGSTACVVQAQHQAPAGAEDAKHFRRWTLAAGAEAAFHNHIPLDPVESSVYGGLISVSKQALTRFASVGEPVGYEIRLTNTTRGRLRGVELHDDLPNAFNFIADSASIQPVENSPAGNPPLFASQPAIPLATRGNDPVVFGPFDLEAESSVVIRYVTRPSTRARQGSYLNTAMPVAPPRIIGNVAEATVNISSDPLFEQTTVLGQVFLDRDGDGVRGIDEPGIPGVRLATVDGLLIETDQNGRYHVAAVEVDNADRGTNFILKLDPETLPEGAEVAGPNPRVLRITQSLMSRIDFAVQYDENHVRELYEEVPARAVVERTLTRYNTDRLQPVRFESGLTDIPPEYVEQLQQLLDEYADRDNLRVRFVGHTDDVPLSVRIQPEFGDNQGLSEARAREVAEFFSGQLELDPVMVEIEGRAFRQPVASNLTEGGRALNRRVEIEVVFDEVITETSEEFEPEDPSAVATEPETEVSYITMTDVIEPVRFGPDIVALTGEKLDALENSLDAYSGENIESVRLSGVSYVAPGSGDDEALEQARQRAVNVGEAVAGLLGLDESQLVVEAGATTELLAADDTEFGQSLNRRVEVEVSYLSVAEQISSRTILLQPAQLGRTTVVEGAGRIWMTEDAFSREAQLAVLALQPISVNDNGRMTAPTAFAAHGNYEGVAESYRLDLYRATDVDLSRPIASVTASGLAWPQAFSLFDRQLTLEPGEQLAYVLRVIDGSGNQDYTTAQLVNVVADGQPAAAAAPENVIGKSILEGRRITLEGSKVRIHGADFEPGERLEVAGMDVQADVNGKFVTELFLPPGNAEIEVNGGSEGSRWREMLRPEIDENYSFIVGMASLTLGQDSFGGAFEALSDADEFDESLWLDGRLAFYAKARIQGKYLLTAQMDSTEDELSNFGDNLRRRDPRRMFRQLDPDRYYPVYGDDSTTVSDVDTQGALYIRLDWDRNQLLFGNYNTGLTGTENLAYNRSLYGARAQFESERHTAHGDPRYSATAFASESESAAAHVSFRATGGSVYYLRHTDVVQGSEKVWMEVRQRDTRQVIGRREYVEGLDYEIDALQGRIILRRPLQPVSNDYNSAIIRRGIDGDAVYLLVDYEYVPAGFSGDNWIAGGRGKVWLTENFGIGATGITDDSTGEDYRLQGFDISLKTSPGTYFNVEVASSEAAQNAAGFESFDGGLRFSSMDYDNSGQISRGDAIAVEGRIDIADISEMFAGNVRAWWKDRDPGFSSGNIMRNQIVREAGVDAVVRDDEGMLVQASVSELETADGGSANVARLQGDISRDRLTIGGEVRYEDLTRSFATAGFGGVRPAVRGDALMAGARAGYALNEDQTLYASVQTGLDESGQHVNNDRIAAGLETRISEDLSVLVEASDGDFGNALSGGVSYAPVQNFSFDVLSGVGAGAVSEFGGNYQLENGHELYASYISDPDRTFGDGDMFTLGQRRDFGNRFGVYTESHFGENDYYAGANHSFGIDYATESDWILSGVVTTANDDMFANELEREAVSFGASVDREDYKFSARTEYRTDKGSAFEIEQQLFASSYTRVLSESSRVLGRLNLLRTDDDSRGAAEHARFTEFDIGHAWRPAALERWTTLTRYSYLYDAAGAYQIGGGPDQKVHIVSAEALYQFNTRWEIGGKIAWKNGEARAALGIGEWHDYEVSLAVARARYNVVSEWDVLAEYRVLEDRSAGNARDGVLVGAYRSLSENFQIGAGYNFSDFSDDLRDAEYDKRGFFIDIVGSL
ncbi:MAG: OmpA family protein [Gammaproteobacteria bacterium]|nr:OmpA family protein [Gammaproteobacteria bacterium]MYE28403.1 OmpA family protein [Gammaproteobacteria bacterium]